MAHSLYRTGLTASIDLAWPVIAALEAKGFSLDELLGPAGLTRSDFDDPNRRIDQAVLCDLWDRAVELTGDERFGLHALPHGRVRLVGFYVLRHSATFRDAIQRGTRLQRLWQEGRDGSLEVEGDRATLRWRVRAESGVRFSRAMSEFVLAGFTVFLHSGLLDALLEVHFPLPVAGSTEELEHFFKAELRFDTGEQALVFPARLLDDPNPHADPVLLGMLESHAERLLETLPPTRSFADGVRNWITRELADGDVTLEHIAARLAISPRTLRRRLADEGTTFRQLLDETRYRLATDYLVRDMTVQEVAFTLGFADAAAFGKAFKRLAGVAPSEYRQAQAGGRSERMR